MPESKSVEVLPLDSHNRLLVSRVHPGDWTNPEPEPRYNLVAIGGGTAGLVSAAGATGLGARCALIEKHLLGGDCLNVGCVPSKALIRSSRAVADAREAGAFGVDVSMATEVDFASVMERMRRLRSGIAAHDSAERFRKLGVDVFLGKARFVSPDAVQVGGHTLRFARAVIATGGRAAAPPIEGLAEAGYLTNETLFSLTELPPRLGVIGGGPIGCEMAQAFQRFGSQVSVFQCHPQILDREDAKAGRRVQDAFRREGIQLFLDSSVFRVESRAGEKQVHLECNGQTRQVAVDEVLVAAGRAPNVEGLGLEAAGVDYDRRRGVLVNDQLQTSNKRIYSAGDVCSQYKFTHAADALARIVIQNALFMGRKKASTLTIPWCTYTDPEVAHVGLNCRETSRQGIEYDLFVREFAEVDRAITDGEEEGMVSVLVAKGTDKILGATVVARHAGEMINEITLAMVAGLGLGTLSQVIHPYPTQAEAIKQVGDAYNRTRLTPRARRVLSRWFAWRR